MSGVHGRWGHAAQLDQTVPKFISPLARSVLTVGAVLVAGALLGRPAAAQQFTLAVGDEVPKLEGLALDGTPVTVDYGLQGKPTVVYVITPFSYFVVRNEANFATVVRQAAATFRVIVLSPNPTGNERLAEYIHKVKPGWGNATVEIVKDISPDLKKDMMLGGYPQTLVISTQSRVVKNFMGAYSPESLSAKPADIEAFFSVKLPGLSGGQSALR
jgi:hypothetical protein